MSSTQSQRILVVDDEPGIRDGLKASLEHLGFDVETAESGEEAIYQFKQHPEISFVISDYKLPGLDGFDVLKEVKKQSPRTRFVLMTGYGNVNHAVNAIQLGADDYLCKPFGINELERMLAKSSSMTDEEEGISSGRIITEDSGLENILRKAERAAKSAAPILIEGASGTGKELLARQIHEWSLRKDKPWVAINCAALPSGLLESELFGFEKGAFTGAIDRKIGKFELANGGTLLLDEIGELDPLLQAKLLRVLQEGEVDRLGGRKPFKTDVRIIATTNKNLELLVKMGKFREDLFFRLYGVRFTLPSLKDRTRDITILAERFLTRESENQHRDLRFARGVLEALQQMSWPGNIRQLEKAIERASVLSESGEIHLEHFEFSEGPGLVSAPSVRVTPFTETSFELSTKRPIREMEMEIILKALEAHGGNRTHTAKSLGMSLRTLRHKIKQYREQGRSIEPARQNQQGPYLPNTEIDAAPLRPFAASTTGQEIAR